MASLGYERYGAHGNDSGSMISPELGRHDPDRVVGVHVTQLFSFPSGDPAEFANLTPEETMRRSSSCRASRRAAASPTTPTSPPNRRRSATRARIPPPGGWRG